MTFHDAPPSSAEAETKPLRARRPRLLMSGVLAALIGVTACSGGEGGGSGLAGSPSTAGASSVSESPGASGSTSVAGTSGGSAPIAGSPASGGNGAGGDVAGNGASGSPSGGGSGPGGSAGAAGSSGGGASGSAALGGGGSAGTGSGGKSGGMAGASGAGGMNAGGSGGSSPAGGNATGALHVEGRHLVEGDGRQVLFRGPELVHRWGVYAGITSLGVDVPWEGGKNNNVGSATIREIGKTKANAMRLLGGIGNELDELLRTAIVEQKMYVAVARVDWTNPQMKATLQKYAKYIILHPRGEFTYREDDPANAGKWRTDALRVIREIRALGYTSPIEIGTTGYGQTWSTIKNFGPEVAASDPLKNTLFLLQLYSEYAKMVPATLNEIAAFPYPVIVDACLFTSTYGNTPNTYKEVWDQTLPKQLSSFYWDWWGDGEGNSMTTNGQFSNLNAIGQYIVNDSPAALKNTVKGAFLLNAAVP